MENKRNNNIIGLPERYCAICGKLIIPSPGWVYKIGDKKGNNIRYKYYCCYTHWRKAGGDGGIRKYKNYK